MLSGEGQFASLDAPGLVVHDMHKAHGHTAQPSSVSALISINRGASAEREPAIRIQQAARIHAHKEQGRKQEHKVKC